MLLHIAIVALSATKWLRTSIIVGILALVPAGYMVARLTHTFTGDTMLDFVGMIEPTRAESLQFRLDAELNIIRNAMEKPWFGYGSDPLWRARLSDEIGR